jgi:hypothetical protein
LLGDGIQVFGSSPYKALAGMARRLIAAECAAFLEDADLDSELWGPYVRWANLLSPERHTILTFNYDRLPDLLAAHGAGRLQVVLPGGTSAPDRVPVYKLHGSVDWLSNGSRVWAAPERDGQAHFHTSNHEELVLATPGPMKRDVMNGLLSQLWDRARLAIQGATAIVFVGYRFPPSDSEARYRILEGIRSNTEPILSLHVILGPTTGSETSTRMRWMLTDAARRGDRMEKAPGVFVGGRPQDKTLTIVQPPAWAEDFMDTIVDGHLLQAYRYAWK